MNNANSCGRHRQKRRWKPEKIDLWVVLVGLTATLMMTGVEHPATASSTTPAPRTPEAMTTPHRAITVVRRSFLPQEPALLKQNVVLDAIETSGGRYVWAAASLPAADCSGLVSVAQSLAMGQEPHRLGDTHSLLAGRWPGAIPGASSADQFVIGVSPSHMVAMVNGVRLESRSRGMPYLIGDQAASPWDREFTRQYHIDPTLLVNL